MPEVIRQLSEHVANQIAAGEVIQRPASVVKELMENAVDAGATKIIVRAADAGRTLIHVSDNGVGMIPADARKCFDRHATSKISSAEDLFSIVSKGFRGEALASVASISHVELKTRHASEDLGTHIQMEGGDRKDELPCPMEVGTQISVKHLFYNVPARRNFLKSDAVEMRHVVDEFQRVALAHESIDFVLSHNGTELFNLPAGSRRKRIVAVFGAKYDERLVPVEESTDVVSISGFVGKPAFARRTRGEQFLFVNQRFIKHGLLHRTVMQAYQGLLPSDQFPLYVLFLTIDPAKLDVNIHPTKTEVQFEEDRHIQSLVLPSIRRGLGKYAVAPSLDFDQETSLNIEPYNSGRMVAEPAIQINTDYNPFHSNASSTRSGVGGLRPGRGQMDAWKSLYGEAFSTDQYSGHNASSLRTEAALPDASQSFPVDAEGEVSGRPLFQYLNRFIVTSTRSGVIFIDQNRAHQRVLYEMLVTKLEENESPISTQQLLFPEVIELNEADRHFILESKTWLQQMGLLVESHDSGIQVTGTPAEGETSPQTLIEAVLQATGDEYEDISRAERVAAQMAEVMAVRSGATMKPEAMVDLVDRLFGCSTPGLDPFGRMVIVNFGANEIEQRFS